MDGLQVQWLPDSERVNMAAIFADSIRGLRRAISDPTRTATTE
jgi:hypothetical protein